MTSFEIYWSYFFVGVEPTKEAEVVKKPKKDKSGRSRAQKGSKKANKNRPTKGKRKSKGRGGKQKSSSGILNILFLRPTSSSSSFLSLILLESSTDNSRSDSISATNEGKNFSCYFPEMMIFNFFNMFAFIYDSFVWLAAKYEH